MNENSLHSETTSDDSLAEPDGSPPEPGVRVQIADEQSRLTVDYQLLETAVQAVLRDSSYRTGAVSIAIVDDPSIHEINRKYLEHDYPTDVLSFVLEDEPPQLEGELVVSTDTASTNATEYGWSASNELLLYVLHGTLHLVGYRDKQPDEIAAMRSAEAKYLRELGVEVPSGSSRWADLPDAQPNDGEVTTT